MVPPASRYVLVAFSTQKALRPFEVGIGLLTV